MKQEDYVSFILGTGVGGGSRAFISVFIFNYTTRTYALKIPYGKQQQQQNTVQII